MSRRRSSVEWDAMYDKLHSGHHGVVVTFDYPDGLRTLHASGRIAAFDLARGRWGEDWRGEPCVSSPFSIYSDITGRTAQQHGQDLNDGRHDVTRTARRRAWREGK